MAGAITGSLLRDLVLCERRVYHDLFSSPAARDPVSGFVQMLWAGGRLHEANVVSGLVGEVRDLRDADPGERSMLTVAALDGAADWILGGRLELGDRVGMPDLLRRIDGVWYGGDVKSGAAFDDGLSPKGEYLVQVGHYAALLGDLELGERDRAFVVGRDGEIAWYELATAAGPGRATPAARVADLVTTARGIRDGQVATKAALSPACGLCHWRSVCRRELDAADDLTLIAGLGRSLRASIERIAPTVAALAALPLEGVKLPGVGAERLGRFRDRARLLATPGSTPYAREPLAISRHDRELHFDLEADPLRDLVYLHGALVRERLPDGDREEFVHFFADDETGEGEAFAAAYAFLSADPSAHIFYYSKFERTSYRALQRRYPSVCSAEDVERLFATDRATDLYFDVVASKTEWPLHSYGIKALAKSLGFAWRDADASGAASIAWFDEYRKTGDRALRDRIVEYNRDDCVATTVLLDALLAMPVRGSPDRPDAPAEGRIERP